MSAQTGRRSINDSLRTTLSEMGWQPRAAGWFTRSIGLGWVGVVATGTAVAGMPNAEAMATLHLGARHELTEAEVAAHCEVVDSYQQRTVLTSIGYLMPEGRWKEWHVTPATAKQAATEMSRAVSLWADPWLTTVANDQEMVLIETERGWLTQSSIDLVRHLVATRNFTSRTAAATLVHQAFAALAVEGTGVAARSKMDALERFAATLAA